MYILYESYDDDCRNLKELDLNTKIIAIYNDKEQALVSLKELADNTIILEDGENEWFVKEEILDNENIIGAYRVFNGEIENYNEFYTIILEKVEVFDNAE